MSRSLNLVSNNVQGYGPSESSCLPCLGVSGRAVSISPCPPRSEGKTFQVKLVSSNCSSRHMSFICKASSGGKRRNSDFSRKNRHGFSRSWNRHNEERDSFENLDESEFLSAKNGPLLSLSSNPKTPVTSTPGPREKEIVKLFRQVQAQLRERVATKEERKLVTPKGQNRESETVDSLLKLLRKHSVEQGKRKVSGGSGKELNFDHPRQSKQPDDDSIRVEPQETNEPSFSRPVSSFRRRSPIPRVRYEPIVSALETFSSVSSSGLDDKTVELHSEPPPEHEPEPEPEPEPELEPEPEPKFDLEANMDLVSGLGLEHEEEEFETELGPETGFVDASAAGEMSEAHLLDAEEDNYDEKDVEKQHTEVKDLNSMKLAELRALAKARGMKGFSKLKKSELVGLLSEDSI